MIPIMGRKSILIVDDDLGILNSFKEILEPEGYSVDTARTGSEAIEKCKAQLYNIAIVDINLPDTDGTELLPKINGMLPKARKIILTGYPTLENAVESVNQQADAYIIKPVNPKEFLKVIAENMNKQTEADAVNEEKVIGWIESRYEETKRNRSSRKVPASPPVPGIKE
jgi:DNA-binding NtrC family response regulator